MHLYFNLKHPGQSIADETGTEMEIMDQEPILQAVKECLQEVPELSAEVVGWTLEVTDSSGDILLSIDLGRFDR